MKSHRLLATLAALALLHSTSPGAPQGTLYRYWVTLHEADPAGGTRVQGIAHEDGPYLTADHDADEAIEGAWSLDAMDAFLGSTSGPVQEGSLVTSSRPVQANAARVIHYWDFDTLENELPADVVGGVDMTAVGTPDFSVDATYGSPYATAGNSLNSKIGTPAYLVADVFDEIEGEATKMLFGTGSFSFSYWSWDASDLDADPRGPRVFDFLAGVGIGAQIGSDPTGVFGFRMDDDAGAQVHSRTTLRDLNQPDGVWVHIAVNVDRENNQSELFFNNVSQGTYDIAALTGNIQPGQDLQIGVTNCDLRVPPAARRPQHLWRAKVQQSGLDDLAFYTGLLEESERAALTAGKITPDQITAGTER